MALCRRVPLLLVFFCSFSSLHQIQAENNVPFKLGVNAERVQNPGGGPGLAAVNPGTGDRFQAAAASLTRRRPAGWKLSDEAVCREDLARLCPKQSWNNNLAVLECLQDKKEVNGLCCFCSEPGCAC